MLVHQRRLGLMSPGTRCSHINESQLQTYESTTLFFMTCADPGIFNRRVQVNLTKNKL